MKTKRRPAAPSATISDQLRAIVAERHLTAYGLALTAGVDPSVVRRFLSRERGLTTDTFDRIAGALGLRLAEGRGGSKRGASAPPAVEVEPAEVAGVPLPVPTAIG